VENIHLIGGVKSKKNHGRDLDPRRVAELGPQEGRSTEEEGTSADGKESKKKPMGPIWRQGEKGGSPEKKRKRCPRKRRERPGKAVNSKKNHRRLGEKSACKKKKGGGGGGESV